MSTHERWGLTAALLLWAAVILFIVGWATNQPAMSGLYFLAALAGIGFVAVTIHEHD